MAPQKNNALPSEVIEQASFSRLRRITAYTILLFISFNLVIAYTLKLYSPNHGYEIIQKKWQLLLAIDQPLDWLFLGDSSGNQGIDPATFSELTGASSINLCTVGSVATVDDIWMLEYYIEKHGAPKHVLITHAYDVWLRDTVSADILGQIPISKIQKHIRVAPNWNYFASSIRPYLQKLFPSFYQSTSLKHLIFHPKLLFARKYHIDENGFEHGQTTSIDKLNADMENHIQQIQSPFTIASINEQMIARLADISQEYDIKVYFAHSPIFKDLYRHPVFSKYYLQYQQQLAKICSSNNFYLLNDPPLQFEAHQMENCDHLEKDAARTFTAHLVQQIETIHQNRN